MAIKGIETMRKPDFVGRFYLNFLSRCEKDGLFFMWIEKRKPQNWNNKELIEGIIKDSRGDATFSGEQTPEAISFEKNYDFESIKAGAAPFGMVYWGENSHRMNPDSGKAEHYMGRYVILDSDRRPDRTADFMIKPCSESNYKNQNYTD